MAHIPLVGHRTRRREVEEFHTLRDELFESGLEGPLQDHFIGSMYCFRATLTSLEKLVLALSDHHPLKDEGRLAVAQGYLWYVRDFLAISDRKPPYDEMEHEAQRGLDLVAEITRPKGGVTAALDRPRDGLRAFVGADLQARRTQQLQRA